MILVHVNNHVPQSTPVREHIRKNCSSEANMVSVVSMHLEKLHVSCLTFRCRSLRSRYNRQLYSTFDKVVAGFHFCLRGQGQ
jgi:hypothetical protein